MTKKRVARPNVAIMLDHHLKLYPDDWPMVYIGTNLETARDQHQADAIVAIRPRSKWQAELQQKKVLVDVRTGARRSGGIYRLRPKSRQRQKTGAKP